MSSILDFLAQANRAINDAAKEQAARNALAAAYLNLPLTHPAAAKLASEAQRMLEADKEARKPTAAQQTRAAIDAAPGKPALQADKQLSPLAGVAAQAAKSIAEEIDRQERLTVAAQAYLGIADKSNPAVRRLAASMDLFEKKEVKGAKALKKVFDEASKSAFLASASMTATIAGLRGIASAGNPGVVRALDQSLQLLTARMGTALLPVTSSVISTIGDFTDWFSSLNDSTKRFIGIGAIAVPSVVALSVAALRLAPAVMAATAAMNQMRLAAQQNSLMSAAMNVGGALTGVGLIASLAQYLGHNPNPAESKGRVPTREEMEFAWRVQHGTHGMTSEQWNRLSDKEQKEASAVEAARIRGLRDRGEHNFFNTGNYGLLSGEPGAGVYAHHSDEELDRASEIFERYSRLNEHESSTTKQEISWRKKVTSLNMQASEASRESRPAYSSLADARKTLQLNTLAKGPYEQQLLKESREQLKVLRRLLAEELKRGADKGWRLRE